MPKDAEGIYEPGQTLTEEEKGEILKDVARQKAEQKAVADKVKNAKTSAELGITRKAPAAGSTSKSAAASKPAGIEGMLTAAKKPAAAAAKGAAAKGVGAKSAAGAKPSAGAKPAKPTGSKLAAAKKGGKPAGIEGMITAAKKPVLSPEEQAAAEAAEVEAAAAAAAEAHARRLEADAAADAERERRWAESEAQRQEIQNQIVEEERRVRKREEERRKKLAAEKKKQALLLEAAFDNEQEDVQQMITAWVEECFSPLIGAKLDCLDANEHTPLSEAACGGALEVCTLLLKHGANVNTQNHQGRTPLWRAAFMDKQECVKLLLEVAPNAAVREILSAWDVAQTEVLLAQNQTRLAGQWVPAPPDPADMPIGEPGYSLQIPMKRLSDALDSIMRDSDRYTLCVDLSGKAMTFFTYRDVNLVYAYRPDDVEPQSLRKKLMGALRYGKPLVLDYLSIAIDKEAVVELFDAVLPGLFQLIVSKQILHEENWSRLIREGDDPDYAVDMWKPRNLEFFHFIFVSKLPKLPEWCTDKFFILKVAGS